MNLADEKYLSLTTFRKNGERKPTPIWIADLGDGTMGFTTQGTSWKCRRIRNDARVELQPSDSRGRPTEGSDVSAGTATLGTGAEFERVRTKIKAKYGYQVALIGAMQKIGQLFGKGGDSDTAVIITLD